MTRAFYKHWNELNKYIKTEALVKQNKAYFLLRLRM